MHPVQVDPAQAAWFALTVKPNHEYSAERSLSNQGLETYLPVQNVRRNWSDRVKEVRALIFPGYVFCRFSRMQRSRVFNAAGVRSIVGPGGTPLAIEESEIEAIRTLIATGRPILSMPYLRVGQRVEILEGPFARLRGVVVRVKNAWRVVVSVDALACSIAIEVDSESIAPARVA